MCIELYMALKLRLTHMKLAALMSRAEENTTGHGRFWGGSLCTDSRWHDKIRGLKLNLASLSQNTN